MKELKEACDVIECGTEAEWLAVRQSGLGSSDAATALGLNPYRSPLSLYSEKVSGREAFEVSEPMKWGTLLEPVIAADYAEAHGVKLYDMGRWTVLRSRSCPWMLATLDRVAMSNPPEIVEVKAVGSHMEQHWEEGPPRMYWVQCQHQMAVTGLSAAVITALVGGQRRVEYRIDRDEDFCLQLEQLGELFMDRVQRQDPPPIDGHEATTKALYNLYPQANGNTANLPPEADDWAISLEQVKSEMKRMKEQETLLKNMFFSAIGDASDGLTPAGVRFSVNRVEKAPYTVNPKPYLELRRRAK